MRIQTIDTMRKHQVIVLSATVAAWAIMCRWPITAQATIIIFPPSKNLVPNDHVLGPGFVTNELIVESDTDWTSGQLLVEITEPGLIYQHPQMTSPQSPNPALFGVLPMLEFDTYVSNGSLGDAVTLAGEAAELTGNVGGAGQADLHEVLCNWNELVPVGTRGDQWVADGFVGAHDLAAVASNWGGTGVKFDSDGLSVGWFTTDKDDTGRLAMARITLAASAQGQWEFLADACPPGGPNWIRTGGPIVNGVMLPEPQTLVALVLGFVLLTRRSSKHDAR